MFFLVRSAVCIGLVVSALPDTAGHRGAGDAASLAGASGAAVSTALLRLCADNPTGCRHVLDSALVAGPASAPTAPHRSGRLVITGS